MNGQFNICLPCGLCCNGTFIDIVQLESKEADALRKIMDIEGHGCNNVIIQPCNKFHKSCTIYSQRPKQCDDFKCKLLKSTKKGTVDFDSAIETIELVKQEKVEIDEKLSLLKLELQSQSFHFRMTELRILLRKHKEESPLSEKYSDLTTSLNKFNNTLSDTFGIPVTQV